MIWLHLTSAIAVGVALGSIISTQVGLWLDRIRVRREARLAMINRANERERDKRTIELARAVVAESKGQTHLTAPLQGVNRCV